MRGSNQPPRTTVNLTQNPEQPKDLVDDLGDPFGFSAEDIPLSDLVGEEAAEDMRLARIHDELVDGNNTEYITFATSKSDSTRKIIRDNERMGLATKTSTIKSSLKKLKYMNKARIIREAYKK